MIKAVVFDFDDTLVRSESIKRKGFSSIFFTISGAVPIAERYIRLHSGEPRRTIIRGIITELVQSRLVIWKDIEKKTQEYLSRYGEYTDEAVITAEELPGASDALIRLSKKYILFLNSQTPQETLETIVTKRGWSAFFKEVYGSPPGTKLRNLGTLLKRNALTADVTVVVGDGMNDLDSARQHKCHFIGVAGSSFSLSGNYDFAVIPDFIDFENTLLTFAS